MTVIAYDHKRHEIAVDSACTGEGIKFGNVTKFIELPDGRIAVGCGKLASVKQIFDALRSGDTPDNSWFEDTCVVLVEDGHVYAMDESPYRDEYKRTWAWGTGMEVALGALYMGATAEQAAQAACKYITTCGGPVHVFKTR